MRSKVTTFAALSELILVEELKNCLPERLVSNLNEREFKTMSEATVLADNYMLTHKNTFGSVRSDYRGPPTSTPGSRFVPHAAPSPSFMQSGGERGVRRCHGCGKTGHLRSDCFMWKRQQEKRQRDAKEVGLVQTLRPITDASQLEDWWSAVDMV